MDKKIQKLLDSNKIKYKLLDHRKVYTAFTEAETQHVDHKMVVKIVFVKLSKPSKHLKADGSIDTLEFLFVAVPSKKRVDFKKVAKAVNDYAMKSYKLLTSMAKKTADKPALSANRSANPVALFYGANYKKPASITVKMASEKDITKKLKTKVGLLTAFTQLYNLPLLFDKKLAKNKKLIVSAGSYTESIEIATKDFLKLMSGMQGNFTE